MLVWLAENVSTIVISAVLISIVAIIVAYMIKNKKKGKSSCGCGCASCPMSGSCNQKK